MSLPPSRDLCRKGVLILVVGPSGAGKDSLIDAARNAFAKDGAFHFARRVVTRAAEGEDHDTLTPEAFVEASRRGAFMLEWRAHNLSYGVPAALLDEVLRGRNVVVNVSRGVITQAEALGVPVAVLHVTASPEICAARIASRGRESRSDIEARLRRTQPFSTISAPIVEIRNEGTLEHGARLFIDALRSCAKAVEARAR